MWKAYKSECCWVVLAKSSALGLYDTDKSQADAVKYVKGSIINNGGIVHEMVVYMIIL